MTEHDKLGLEEANMRKGEIVAVREGGDTLVYDYTDADGMDWGHVERGEEKFPVTPVLSIIARGYWEAPTT